MKFLADVPIGRATVEFLRQAGHDVLRSVDRLAATASDIELVELAISENRAVLCFDLDFSAIVATSGQRRPSVITFRTTRRKAAVVNDRLEQVLAEIEAELARGVLVTVEDSRVRVRPLPIVHR